MIPRHKYFEQVRIPCSLWPLAANQPRRHREHKTWPAHLLLNDCHLFFLKFIRTPWSSSLAIIFKSALMLHRQSPLNLLKGHIYGPWSFESKFHTDSWFSVCEPVLIRRLFLADRHFPKDWQQIVRWGSPHSVRSPPSYQTPDPPSDYGLICIHYNRAVWSSSS